MGLVVGFLGVDPLVNCLVDGGLLNGWDVVGWDEVDWDVGGEAPACRYCWRFFNSASLRSSFLAATHSVL